MYSGRQALSSQERTSLGEVKIQWGLDENWGLGGRMLTEESAISHPTQSLTVVVTDQFHPGLCSGSLISQFIAQYRRSR